MTPQPLAIHKLKSIGSKLFVAQGISLRALQRPMPSFLLLFTAASLFYGAYALSKLRPKHTKLVLYVHDYFTGNDASAITVAGKSGLSSSILHFGSIAVVDDLVTEGPDVESKEVGRAQGSYINSALDGTGLYMAFSVIFTNGQFNGSTLEIQGSDPFKLKQREFSVVSGTGFFRFARGYGIMETHSVDMVNLRAIIKLSITVRHD